MRGRPARYKAALNGPSKTARVARVAAIVFVVALAVSPLGLPVAIVGGLILAVIMKLRHGSLPEAAQRVLRVQRIRNRQRYRRLPRIVGWSLAAGVGMELIFIAFIVLFKIGT